MDFKIKRGGMISGQGEVAERVWRLHKGKTGNWLIPVNEVEPGAHVHFHNPNNGGRSEGYGGATLEFKLEDGTGYFAQGPWHSNTEHLLQDAGIDLTDKHLTFVVLSKDRRFENYSDVMVDVVYKDEQPTLGKFDRYKDLIKQFPEAKFYYSESHGGSSCGPIK